MRYFGTDGIRAKADSLLSRGLATKLGAALAERGKTILVARDVRLSSQALENDLVRGLIDSGAEVLLAGVLPTPALAFTAKSEGVDYAVMITASHNAPEYNGLKVFGGGGQKLSLAEEAALDEGVAAFDEADISSGKDSKTAGTNGLSSTSEASNMNLPQSGLHSAQAEIAADADGCGLQICADCKSATGATASCCSQTRNPSDSIGKVSVIDGADFLYAKHIRRMFPRFDGMKVRLDCANGCYAELADKIFSSLGAAVIAENNVRDGNKVNVECGSTHIDKFARRVKRDEIGFAFDGDGDRVIAVVDAKAYDGDAMLLALSSLYRIQGKLRRKFVVGTLLTNTRLQRELAYQGTALLRADVGDKYVLDALLENDCLLGGEKSGHIIMLDKGDTGDGLITALSLMDVKKTMGSLPKFRPYPMYEFNLPYDEPAAEARTPEFKRRVKTATAAIGQKGRIVVRPSGTEPYIRVTTEFFSDNCDELLDAVKHIFGLPKTDDKPAAE